MLLNQQKLAKNKENNQNLNNNNQNIGYEIRYWPKDDFDKANIIYFKGPTNNFTFKNTNPLNNSNNNLYMFQIRCKTIRGWGPFSQSIESIKINNDLLQQKTANTKLSKLSNQKELNYFSLNPKDYLNNNYFLSIWPISRLYY